MTPITDQLCKQLPFEEEERLHVYLCSRGHRTIGIGRNLDSDPYFNGQKIPDLISRDMMWAIFYHDKKLATDELLTKLPFVNSLDDARKDALINMCFQMGVEKVLLFHNMIAALKIHDYDGAADAALDSDWEKQTPDRAHRVAGQLRTGKYYEVV